MVSPENDEMADALTELVRSAARIPVACPASSLGQFEAFIETLLLWGRRLSLTSASTALRVVREPIVDSLHVAPHIKPEQQVADIGSGAGFPGIPLAIVCPQAQFVLFESRRKRANFLREVVRRASLANVEVRETRLDARLPAWRGAFDVTVSRAFGTLEAFLGLSEMLLRGGGRAIAMKGPGFATGSVQLPGAFGNAEMVAYALPHGGNRCLVVCARQ
jgi:16S rRNA (guanine527-N7)-methyltransferase